ncbi:MAG: hypothetical protein EHM51_01280 [Geobacter sp.]|nr:MAG: hypothetical protein EHM51_01280 [Geobacter sp.]
MIMNPIDAVREKIEACFIFNSYAPDNIRQLAGVRMLSQIWLDVPAWYFWLHDVPGAFMMEAFHANTWEHDGATFDSARFVVRYFPSTDSELLTNFSDEENHLRHSSLFDETGTPVYEQLHLVREGHFECAIIEYHFSRSEDTVLMLLGTKQPSRHEPRCTTLEALCTALYESLAGMYSLFRQEPPESTYLPGKENGEMSLRALCFSKSNSPIGEKMLRHYLGIESLAPFQHHSEKERNWQRLALIKPESMNSPGCGCCCGN